MDEWGLSLDFREAAAIVVSELVTNALVHGAPPVRVRLSFTSTQLILEVIDGATLLPRRQRTTCEDEHGRALQVVAAIVDKWGSRPTAHGKCVWCTFDLRQNAQSGMADSA